MKNIYIARQAIYNRKMGVYAYELLYRACRTNRAEFPDALSATSQVLLNSFMEIGIEGLVGNHKAFINLPQNFFTETPPIPFDKDRIVLELLEDLDVNPQLIESVRKLKAEGYTIAIDDYLFEGKWEPLLELVDIIKVEITGLTEQELSSRISQLKSKKVMLLAEKVENYQVYELCRDLGFDLFQGFFFSKPNIIHGRKLDDNRLVVLKLLEKLNNPNSDMEDIERLLSQDAGLSYKVLRYVNSAAVGLPKKVEGIRRAIVLMGLSKIKTWASLIVMTGIQGKPTAVVASALTRAMMCEALVRETKAASPDSAFTAGLFSMLDVMLDQPLDTILGQLPLADEVKEAIAGHRGPDGEALCCAIAYEHHDWTQMSYPGVGNDRVQEIYWDVVSKVHESGLVGA